jgi:ufm1-conjugating enzyme 1
VQKERKKLSIMAESWDPNTRATVQKIPLLTINAGPRDKEGWQNRLKEELQALIKYIEINKSSDLDWFTIKPSNKEGTHWQGKCWYIHELIKYEFDFQVRHIAKGRP